MKDIYVFLGHDFFGDTQRKADYRAAVNAAVSAADAWAMQWQYDVRFHIVYGDTRLNAPFMRPLLARIRASNRFSLGGDYWDQISAVIYACAHALFDLTHRDYTVSYPNANVVLEYGVAFGVGKKPRAFGRTRDIAKLYLSNTAKYNFPYYDPYDMNSLTDVIVDLLTDFLATQP
ncbi:MAG TPA: hypothetical protein VJ183_05740 [Chloroflexia bacterium]|nr:hypothetical protein [Chloroflexia bacterium]